MEISINKRVYPDSRRHPYQPAKFTKEYYALTNSWQLFDEVFFIIKRNLRGNIFNAFIAAVPKLCILLALFTSQISSPGILVILAVMHQLFWRPIAWIAVGTSFLAGFPDHRVRTLSRQDYSWQNIGEVCLANMYTSVFYAGLLAVTILSTVGHSPIDGFEIPALIAWFLLWWCTFTITPAVLLKTVTGTRPTRFLPAGKYLMVFKLAARFSMLLAILYSVLVGNLYALMQVIGLQPSYLGISSQILFVSLIIVADCFIDPFIIGFRMLLSKDILAGLSFPKTLPYQERG